MSYAFIDARPQSLESDGQTLRLGRLDPYLGMDFNGAQGQFGDNDSTLSEPKERPPASPLDIENFRYPREPRY
jgi:hypothetical protein